MYKCRVWACGVAVWGALGSAASAQFTTPTPTSVRERLVGTLKSAEGAPAPESGDQIAVFFGQTLAGLYTFTGESRDFSIVVSGDDPQTDAIEGPKLGDKLTMKFFDLSTNTTRTDVQPLNPDTGEALNLTFKGQAVIDIPLPVPIPDVTDNADALLGATPTGGGGGSTGTAGDLNGDGKIDKKDAALVLRITLGAGRGLPADMIAKADVNGDGVVDSGDAIAILQMNKK